MRLSSVVLAALAVSTNALNLQVASGGGNATSPLQYGLMFEVCCAMSAIHDSADLCRTLTTREMAASMQS
jgi:hypothetical protein